MKITYRAEGEKHTLEGATDVSFQDDSLVFIEFPDGHELEDGVGMTTNELIGITEQ